MYCAEPAHSSKIWSVEFFRILFVFFIILGHCMQKYPQVRESVLGAFGTSFLRTGFGVEFFFVIGGFFLYHKLGEPVWENIKKLYSRLCPALLFVFLLTVITSDISFSSFPSILTLSTGLSIPKDVTGWGDWYVGVYFWCCCLCLVIFLKSREQAFCWLGILMYVCVVLRFHGKNSGFLSTYFSFVGSEVVRGFFSIGIGIVTAALSKKIKLNKCKFLTIIFSIVELYCIAQVLNYIVNIKNWNFNFWDIELTFAIFLFSAASSYGYISRLLNHMFWIGKFSRYAYSIFLAHIVFMRGLLSHNNFSLSDKLSVLIVFSGAILLGVFEYHVIEKRVVPFCGQFFIKEQK